LETEIVDTEFAIEEIDTTPQISLELSFDKFNKNLEYTQNEHKKVIADLRRLLKKITEKILDDDVINHKTLTAVNSLYINLSKNISDFNDNNMCLINKLLELNDKLNPQEISDGETDEDEEVQRFIEQMNKK